MMVSEFLKYGIMIHNFHKLNMNHGESHKDRNVLGL